MSERCTIVAFTTFYLILKSIIQINYFALSSAYVILEILFQNFDKDLSTSYTNKSV